MKSGRGHGNEAVTDGRGGNALQRNTRECHSTQSPLANNVIHAGCKNRLRQYSLLQKSLTDVSRGGLTRGARASLGCAFVWRKRTKSWFSVCKLHSFSKRYRELSPSSRRHEVITAPSPRTNARFAFLVPNLHQVQTDREDQLEDELGLLRPPQAAGGACRYRGRSRGATFEVREVSVVEMVKEQGHYYIFSRCLRRPFLMPEIAGVCMPAACRGCYIP